MIRLLQVYLVDEFQSIARWTAESQFQFEVLLHDFIVYELLFEFFHLVVADVVDVCANQAGVLDEPLVVSTAEGATSQDVVELFRLVRLAFFLVGNATECIRGLLPEHRVGDVRPEVIDAHSVVAYYIGDGMAVELHPMLVELVESHGHLLPPFLSFSSSLALEVSFS